MSSNNLEIRTHLCPLLTPILSPAYSRVSSPVLPHNISPVSLTGSIMAGIASRLQHNRDRDHGIGTNSQAISYLNQDYETLRQHCLESGRLFYDDTFPAEISSLGFKELGPGSYKTRGVTWKRPTVSRIITIIIIFLFTVGRGSVQCRFFRVDIERHFKNYRM